MKTTKKVAIFAGMEFTYSGTIKNKIHKIGFDLIEFTYNEFMQLVSEKRIKRVIF